MTKSPRLELVVGHVNAGLLRGVFAVRVPARSSAGDRWRNFSLAQRPKQTCHSFTQLTRSNYLAKWLAWNGQEKVDFRWPAGTNGAQHFAATRGIGFDAVTLEHHRRRECR